MWPLGRSIVGQDPPYDTMSDRIELKIRSLLTAIVDQTWEPNAVVAVNDVVYPTAPALLLNPSATGRHYVCTVDGTTGVFEPTWSTERGSLIGDGSVTWRDAGVAMAGVPVFYRGAPGIVPARLYPFGEVFLSDAVDTKGQDGYREMAGMEYLRYEGYVAFEVLHRDPAFLVPNAQRSADVPSYLDAKELTHAAVNALTAFDWKNVGVQSFDVHETTIELRYVRVRNALAQRKDSVANRGEFEFNVYTGRLLIDG